jgi:hypothetical protein
MVCDSAGFFLFENRTRVEKGKKMKQTKLAFSSTPQAPAHVPFRSPSMGRLHAAIQAAVQVSKQSNDLNAF